MRAALWLIVRGLLLLALVAEVTTVASIVLAPNSELPSTAVREFVAVLRLRGAPEDLANETTVGFGLNVVLFMPLGFLAMLIWPRARWWLWTVAAFLMSVVLEAAQLMALPERTAKADDVLSNTLGAFIGTVAALVVITAFTWIQRRVWPRSQPQPETSTERDASAVT